MLWQLVHLFLVIIAMHQLSIAIALIQGEVIQCGEIEVKIRLLMMVMSVSMRLAAILGGIASSCTRSSRRSGRRLGVRVLG